MRRETFEEALRRFSQAVPFQKYTIELMNGERLIGHHPEVFDLIGDLVVYVEPDEVVQAFDASSVARFVSVVVPPGAH